MKKATKNKYGQYFTPALVADFMVDLATYQEDAEVMEPCCGEGVFLQALSDKGFKNVTAFEIDSSLSNLYASKVNFRSFVSEEFEKKFDLIIGNPPYIRWQHLEQNLKNELLKNRLWNQYFNSLCDYLYIFILKSIELLNENGELIFICPEYWMNTTHALTLRNYLSSHGYFKEIYHFNETPIFNKVTVSIVIFKYIKNRKRHPPKISLTKYYSAQKLTPQLLSAIKKRVPYPDVEYAEIEPFKNGERWLLASEEIKNELQSFEKHCAVNGASQINLFEKSWTYHTIGEICDIGNGLVSGLDHAFQLNGHRLNQAEKTATIRVVKAKDLKPYHYEKTTSYIFLPDGLNETQVQHDFSNFYKHLSLHKNELHARYQYNREIKFWEWVFLRNFQLFNQDEPRIFVPCKERISNKNYFRFAFVGSKIFPTQDVTAIFKKEHVKESIYYILAMLNNHRTFQWLKHHGIVKGNIVEFSEKPIASIPIKLINWNNAKEVKIHRAITEYCTSYVANKDADILTKLESEIDQLF